MLGEPCKFKEFKAQPPAQHGMFPRHFSLICPKSFSAEMQNSQLKSPVPNFCALPFGCRKEFPGLGLFNTFQNNISLPHELCLPE